MPITKSREKFAPIRIEQCTLNKFFPSLPESKDNSLLAEKERRKALSNGSGYKLRMKRNGTIYIKETNYLIYNSRLIKNGYNSRIVILDNGLEKHELHFQRTRCPH